MTQKVLCLKECFLIPSGCKRTPKWMQLYWKQAAGFRILNSWKVYPWGLLKIHIVPLQKKCGGKKPEPILACVEQPHSPPPGTKRHSRGLYSTEARMNQTVWNFLSPWQRFWGKKSQYSMQFSYTSWNNIQILTFNGFLNWSNICIYLCLKISIINYTVNLWKTVK